MIPDNTTITFSLPPRAEIIGNIEPEAEVTSDGTRNYVKWTGYKSANRLNLKYVVWNVPSLSITELLDSLVNTIYGQTIILIFALIVLGIIVKRKKIANKIEDYVSSNSKFNEED